MVILHINTVCNGSTGSIAIDIMETTRQSGNKCYIAYGQGTTSEPDSFKIGSKFENKFHGLFFSRILGLQGYGTYFGTKKLLRWMNRIKPDVIHLHNLHGNYLNHPMLFRYIIEHRIPVVITLHDCYNFTGKCSHYTAENCYKWQTECKNCPLIHRTIAPSYLFDWSNKIFRDKRKWYSLIDKMYVVPVSKWLQQQAEQSILSVNNHRIKYIYNWVDYTKFHPATIGEIDSLRRKYGLSNRCRYLVSVGAGWSKNTSKYQDAIQLAARLPEGYKLLLVGAVAKGTCIEPPIFHIPFVSNPQELSAIYSMATAYIHLSVEDTFGKVIAEAMACGTPPIVFDSTACPEIAEKYGFIIPPHDMDAILKILPKVVASAEDRAEMVEYVKLNYNYLANANRYVELYKSIL